ncbi:hypothetical protein ABZS66_28200 [Dactylosporangium sp. NPDC005572]|uniref:hypothetical protein n=1 Tax=Dactylosporangium sp. NPDC005572 TaxID=3156889 RepID=UPI0033A60B80
MLAADTIREHLAGHRVMGWLAPDTATGNQLTTDLTLLVEHLLERGGVVDMFDDRSAVAVWAAANGQGRLPSLASLRRGSVDAAYAGRCAVLEAILHASARSCDGHLLLVIAARNDVISPLRVWTLLRRHHQQLDARRLTGHALALDPATRWLMRRLGYTSGPGGAGGRGGPGGRLPNGTPWWPMRREPQPTRFTDPASGGSGA